MAKKYLLIGLILMVAACKTYTVAPNDFKNQLISVGANQLRDVTTNNPLGFVPELKFKANNLILLDVVDKKGTPYTLQNSPAIEMRVTLKNGKRKIFYLDTVILENDTLHGCISRILDLKSKVPFDQITKIEVQDGGKNYYYTNKRKTVADIDQHIMQISDDFGEVKDRFEFAMDSIAVKVSQFKDFYIAIIDIEKSHSKLDITFYKNHDALELASVRENSSVKEGNHWTNIFFIDNNQVIFRKKYGLTQNTIQVPQKDEKNFYESNQFNPKLDTRFLENFIFRVYRQIRQKTKVH